MKKKALRNLGIVLTLAVLSAGPRILQAQEIVGGGNPDPGTGDGKPNAAMYIPLVIALATT